MYKVLDALEAWADARDDLRWFEYLSKPTTLEKRSKYEMENLERNRVRLTQAVAQARTKLLDTLYELEDKCTKKSSDCD